MTFLNDYKRGGWPMLDLSTFIPTSLWALHFGKLTEYLWEHLAPLQYIPGSACWKALAANGDLSSESAAHFCIKTFLKSIWTVRVVRRCIASQVFFPCPAITLHHGHSCCVAADLSPRNMILFIIWPSFGRRLPATPDPWFTPVRVCMCVSRR